MKNLIRHIFVLLATLPAIAAMSAEIPRTLVFATLHWEGTFSGFGSTPATGAIYTISENGTGQRKIVDLGGNTTNPRFSPDGAWIYFQSNATGRSQFYRCRADGGEVTNLSALHQLGEAWAEAFGTEQSGDGRKLVYTVHDGKTGQVVVCNADGTDAKFVAPSLGYVYMASLNQAGNQVAFSGPAREYRLLIANLPDGEPRLLTPDHPESFVPQFTPDGKTIVFIRRDGDIYRVGADGKDLCRLTNGNQYGEFHLSPQDEHGSTDGPRISRDGKRIAYIAKKDGVPQVCTMNIDGSNQRQLTKRPAACGRVRWSPDGQRLAFVSFEGDRPQLFVIDALGKQPPKKLTGGPDVVYWVEWQP